MLKSNSGYYNLGLGRSLSPLPCTIAPSADVCFVSNPLSSVEQEVAVRPKNAISASVRIVLFMIVNCLVRLVFLIIYFLTNRLRLPIVSGANLSTKNT